MKNYCVNEQAQENGDHEVHHEDCRYLPHPKNQKHLGEFSSCIPAVAAAKKYYQQVNGCKECSAYCHTQ